MMNELQSLTIRQLRRALKLKGRIESLEAKLAAIAGGRASGTMTERNAQVRKKTDRRSSPATRAKLAAAAKARWAKAKAAGKSRL